MSSRSHLTGIAPIRAKAIVFRAIFGIRQDLVGLGDLLETGLGRFVSWIQVRVVLACKLPEGLADVLVVGIPLDAENVVIVASSDGALPPGRVRCVIAANAILLLDSGAVNINC